MRREWKPGDVAMRISALGPPMPSMWVVGCVGDEHTQAPHWHHANGGWDFPNGRSKYRPLVVIDPANDEQVKRLFDAYCTTVNRNRVDAMQAALRSLIAPSKPEEPQGLGAVVEDAEGRRWVRLDVADGPWHLMPPGPLGVNAENYADVTAVRILSGGVS